MWVARLPRGRSLSEWYDKEQPLECSRDGWQIDRAALRTIGDHMGVIVAYQTPHLDACLEARGSLALAEYEGWECAVVATSALAGWLDLGAQRTGMLDSVRFTPSVL